MSKSKNEFTEKEKLDYEMFVKYMASLIKKYGKKGHYEATSILNFNSTNKFSACSFKGIGTFALGAPDVLLTLKKSDPVAKLIN